MLPDDPALYFVAFALAIAETGVVGITIMLCQPSAPASDAPKESESGLAAGRVRDAGGYFARFGFLHGWMLCFLVMVVLSVLPVLPFGTLASVVLWWVVSLTWFGLTVRQTLKLNVALALLYVGILLALGIGLGQQHVR